MSDFKREPIRSRALLNSARGQPCAMKFPNVCNGDWSTTVSAHIIDETAGMGIKADDTSTVHCCESCHTYYDQKRWIGELSKAVVLDIVLRAMQRTLRNRVERGILTINARPYVSRKPPTKTRQPRK